MINLGRYIAEINATLNRRVEEAKPKFVYQYKPVSEACTKDNQGRFDFGNDCAKGDGSTSDKSASKIKSSQPSGDENAKRRSGGSEGSGPGRSDGGGTGRGAGEHQSEFGTDRGSGALGANPIAPPESRIRTSRQDKTSPADRSVILPRLVEYLDDHQQEGVAKSIYSMDKVGGVIVADGTGVGKTREMLAISQHYLDHGKKVVVVAPMSVLKADWKKGTVTGSYLNDSNAMGVNLNLTKDKLVAGAVNLTTYENLSKIKSQVDGDVVLMFDEAHSLKNYDSARTKHGTKMADNAHAVLFASATPIDKWEHLHYLDRAGIFGDQSYAKTYQKLGLELREKRGAGGRMIKTWEPVVKNSEILRRMAGLFDRVTQDGKMIKREISMEGVPVNVKRIDVPQEAHDALERIQIDLEGTSANAGLERARILMHQRRQLEPYKVVPVVDMAEDALGRGRQVVIFASRVNESTVGDEDDAITSEGTMKLLKEELARRGITDVAEIHGGISDKKRPLEMQKFQESKARVVIATVESGGTGINLDDTVGDAPRTMIMMTAPFSAVENVQAAGRVWRLKTQSIPEINYVFANDTEVDDWNAAIIMKKMSALGAAVGGQTERLNIKDAEDENVLDYVPEDPYIWEYPTGRKQSTDASFGKLPNGDWGIRIPGKDKPKPGDVVLVKKKDGSSQELVVGEIVKSGRDHSLATISREPVVRDQIPPPPPPPEEPAKKYSDEKKSAIHDAIKQLAAMDQDRASEVNGMGFNKMDGQFGHSLAMQGFLTDKQAEAAEGLVNKYRRQLDEYLVSKATQKEPDIQLKAVEVPKAARVEKDPLGGSVNWSDSRPVKTSRGEKMLRTAYPTNAFWTMWRKDKESIKKSGVQVTKYQGEWQLSWWSDPQANESMLWNGVDNVVLEGWSPRQHTSVFNQFLQGVFGR